MMFSPQTEHEITCNTGIAVYGGLVTLTAHAYNELLMAARMWDAQRTGVGANRGDVISLGSTEIRLEPQPDGSIKPIAL